jgi:hypothetical protein
MTETAIVLFVEKTKHVLAVVTRTGDPAAAPKPEELGGERFPVRDSNGDVLVEIEPDQLEAKVVPFDEDLLISPQLCEFKDGATGLLSGGAVTPAITTGGVTVTVPAAQTVKTPVWAQVDFGTGQTRRHEVVTGEIAAGATSVQIPKTFASGEDYDVLALAAGFAPGELIDKAL